MLQTGEEKLFSRNGLGKKEPDLYEGEKDGEINQMLQRLLYQL